MNKSENKKLNEELLQKWILISAIIKNHRVVRDITYLESVFLGILARNYPNYTTLKEIINTTNTLKSQLNRVSKSLLSKNYITKRANEDDHRKLEFALTREGELILKKIHTSTLAFVDSIIDIIGKDDAQDLIDIFDKLISNYQDKKGK